MHPNSAHRVLAENLRQIMTNGSLVFSNTDPRREAFHCMVRIGFPSDGGLASATNYLVYWHAGRAIITVLSDAGLPFCYMSNCRLVTVDGDGALIMRERGCPTFMLGMNAYGSGIVCDVSFDSGLTQPHCQLDLATILGKLISSAVDISVSHDGLLIDLRSARSRASIELARTDGQGTAITSVAFVGPDKDSLAVDLMASASLPSRNSLNLSREMLETAGFGVRGGFDNLGRLAVTVPVDFGNRGRERQTASRLLDYLFPRSR